MAEPDAAASVDIAAPPERVYGLITDLTSYTEIAAETAKISWRKGDSAAVGNVFAGKNDNGKRKWTTKCRITDADGSRFGFDVTSYSIPVSHWEYVITPTATGCQVTESSWDRRPGWFRKPAEMYTMSPNRVGKNQTNIEATLGRLKAKAEAS